MIKKLLEKIFSLKKLKEVSFNINKLNIEDISKIKGENSSLIKAEIRWNNKNDDFILSILENKFPNLTSYI